MIRSLPLAKLVASPRNVRRTRDPQADAQLKADIAARGLLQNLVVSRVARPRGAFAVEAGGRRLAQLHALQADGALPADHEVPCLVLERGVAASETSLAENFQRLAMNPADECLAFRQMIADGADVDGVAKRFGLTVRFVEGRLRLANLAPVVFEALGAGDITLDLAKAYASTTDQERQAQVFEQMSRGYGYAHPDSIRRMMTQETASGADRRAQFVGEAAYLDAGGRIERDLFAGDDDTRWLDIALLERLAGEKLQDEAARLAAELGYGFVRPTLERWVGQDLIQDLQRLAIDPVPLTDEESELVGRLESEIEGYEQVFEDEDADDAARDGAQEAIRSLCDRIDALTERQPELDPEVKARAGVILLLDEQGQPKLDPTIWISAEECIDPGFGQAGEGGPDDEARLGDDGSSGGAGRLSQRLIDELAIQRRDILAVHVAADPALALDLAIFLMIEPDVRHSFENRGSTLSASRPSDPVFGFEAPDAPATVAASEAETRLDRGWSQGETLAERFELFRTLSENDRATWLGYAVARTLEASGFGGGGRACAFHDHLGQVLGIDVAAWWRPTGANFFDRVPKSIASAALAEVGGEALANRYAKAKKAELAQACERIFAGDFIAEAEVKQAALAWVPAAMRFALPVTARGEAEGWTDDLAESSTPDASAEDVGGDAAPEVSAGETAEVDKAA
jgi:ParB family chromosome partitioning protein